MARGWGFDAYVATLPSLADLAELAALAGDRGLLMNPPDQWAEPPDSGPIISSDDFRQRAAFAAFVAEGRRMRAEIEADRQARLDARRAKRRPSLAAQSAAAREGSAQAWRG